MNRNRVIAAAERRGIYFDGRKVFRNSLVGYSYEFCTTDGIYQSDTLEGIYHMIMSFPILPGTVIYVNYETGKVITKNYK